MLTGHGGGDGAAALEWDGSDAAERAEGGTEGDEERRIRGEPAVPDADKSGEDEREEPAPGCGRVVRGRPRPASHATAQYAATDTSITTTVGQSAEAGDKEEHTFEVGRGMS